jgi:hypothetical protein
LDRLFVSERIQTTEAAGFRTWQIPVLNNAPEPYNAGDYIPKSSRDRGWDKYREGLITVDEKKWLKFFHRRRWFDLRVDCFTHILDPFPEMRQHPTNWWTVDNPVIWEHLRLSIEIANRILLQMLKERNAWYGFAHIDSFKDVILSRALTLIQYSQARCVTLPACAILALQRPACPGVIL